MFQVVGAGAAAGDGASGGNGGDVAGGDRMME
jgi:hypothetical protein